MRSVFQISSYNGRYGRKCATSEALSPWNTSMSKLSFPPPSAVLIHHLPSISPTFQNGEDLHKTYGNAIAEERIVKLLEMILEAQKLHRGDGERRRLVTNLTQGNSPVQRFERQPRRLVQCWLSPQAGIIHLPSLRAFIILHPGHSRHAYTTYTASQPFLLSALMFSVHLVLTFSVVFYKQCYKQLCHQCLLYLTDLDHGSNSTMR